METEGAEAFKSESEINMVEAEQKGRGVYIHRISVTEDGSITILASSESREGSHLIHEIEDQEGVVMCRVNSSTIKTAMETRRKWNLRYRDSHKLSFKRHKNQIKSLQEEIGELPRPNWSYVEIIPQPNEDGAVISLPIEPTASFPHLYVVSGNSFVPLLLSEDDYGNKSESSVYSSEMSTSSSSLFNSTHNVIPQPQVKKQSSVDRNLEPLCISRFCFSERQSVKYLQSQANSCIVYKILENGLLEIGLQSFENCSCSTSGYCHPYFGPWIIAIDKHLIGKMDKCEVEWKKKAKMKGPVWPPETPYRLKTSFKDGCLRAEAGPRKVAEVLEYIMDTNKEKFHSESPINIRLSWFIEKQLQQTTLDNKVLDWNVDDVLEWLHTKMGYPQYQACFEANGIRGRHLVLLDAEALEKMGIRNFDHILDITTDIRRMLKTTREKNVWRYVSESRYDPITLYTMHNFKKITKRLPIHDFFVNGHFVNRKVPNYSLFEIKKPVWDVFPRTFRRAEMLTYFAKGDNEQSFSGKENYQIHSKW